MVGDVYVFNIGDIKCYNTRSDIIMTLKEHIGDTFEAWYSDRPNEHRMLTGFKDKLNTSQKLYTQISYTPAVPPPRIVPTGAIGDRYTFRLKYRGNNVILKKLAKGLEMTEVDSAHSRSGILPSANFEYIVSGYLNNPDWELVCRTGMTSDGGTVDLPIPGRAPAIFPVQDNKIKKCVCEWALVYREGCKCGGN